MSKLIQISDAEWVVMEVLWSSGSATAADVISRLADVKTWNHRTVRSLLTRLVDKGALDARAVGHRYVYRPAVRRDKCVREESQSFLEKVFAGDAAELLVHFVRHARITPAEIERLRKLLDEKQSESD
jgi:BlaI family penicillinase repressor